MFLLQGPTTVFGRPIRPNAGPVFDSPVEGISTVAIFGIRMALIIGLVMVLVYLLWGAFEWITGGGEQEKLDKARQKITSAIIGILIMVASLGIFMAISGDVLGLIKRDASGNWRFSLPTVGTCIQQGAACDTVSNNRCCAPNVCTATPPTTAGICQ